jgi:hypothetical protein
MRRRVVAESVRTIPLAFASAKSLPGLASLGGGPSHYRDTFDGSPVRMCAPHRYFDVERSVAGKHAVHS